jgi:hypothetical protein
MTTSKGQAAAAVALSLGLLPCCWADSPRGSANERAWVAWLDHRIQDWQPTPQERRFDEIGWARDIRTAERLARQHGRPVFLFTFDGASLAHYRC